MRIGLIAPPWLPIPPVAYGGTERVIDGLARGLAAHGNDVVLFTTKDSTCPVPKRFHLPEAVGIENVAAELYELRHVIAAYRSLVDVDIIHDHTMAGPAVSRWFPGLPVVTTNHGPFADGLEELYGFVADHVAVVAISAAQAASAGAVPIAAMIHHGIELSGVRTGLGEGGYALFLGRMSPTKGVHDAARIARAAGIPLRIAGKMREPKEIEYFDTFVRPQLGPDVEYVGEVGTDDAQTLLGEALCLLNPLAWPEPFGMVMIEALASGTPVVATPVGAAPEIVDDGVTGFLAAGDAALVEALALVPDLDRTACRKAAEERFSLDRMVAEHLALYRRLLDRR